MTETTEGKVIYRLVLRPESIPPGMTSDDVLERTRQAITTYDPAKPQGTYLVDGSTGLQWDYEPWQLAAPGKWCELCPNAWGQVFHPAARPHGTT